MKSRRLQFETLGSRELLTSLVGDGPDNDRGGELTEFSIKAEIPTAHDGQLLVSTEGYTTATRPASDDDEIPFDEAEIFFELNNTDGDL